MLASELVVKLQELIVLHGDRAMWYEADCVGCAAADVEFDADDGEFKII